MILMPLSSETTTFEVPEPLSGSRQASRMPAQGTWESQEEAHEGLFWACRLTLTPNKREKDTFVILMPLSSEITTFEGLWSCRVGSGVASKCCLQGLARARESHDSNGDIISLTFE